MDINKNSPLPAYMQLKNMIMEKIRAKEYRPDEAIPSERQLSSSMNVSRMTVRQAFRSLEDEGRLYRVKGKGTFVSRPLFEQKNVMSFTDLVESRGFKPYTKVLLFEIVKGPSELKNIFDMKKDESFYHVKRLRLADSSPVAIEEVFLPMRLCPSLVRDELYESLYKLLKRKYDYTITRTDCSIAAVMPDREQAALLNSPPDIPLLAVSGTNYNQDGIRTYYESSFYRADEFKYNININLY